MNMMDKINREQLKSDLPELKIGDTLKIHTRIIEGDKERVQIFTGTMIGRRGAGIGETIKLRRVAFGQGMERVFPLHSPRIAKIEVVKNATVRRAKLYYLRDCVGKATKLKEKR